MYPAYTVPVRIPASVTAGLPSGIIDARRRCCKHKLALSPPVLHFLPETDTGCTNPGKGARNQSSPSRGAQSPEATTLSCSFSRTEMIVALIRQIRSAQPPAAVLWQAVFFPRCVQLASAANLPREISCLHGTGQGARAPLPSPVPRVSAKYQMPSEQKTLKTGVPPTFPFDGNKKAAPLVCGCGLFICCGMPCTMACGCSAAANASALLLLGGGSGLFSFKG